MIDKQSTFNAGRYKQDDFLDHSRLLLPKALNIVNSGRSSDLSRLLKPSHFKHETVAGISATFFPANAGWNYSSGYCSGFTPDSLSPRECLSRKYR